MSDSTSGLASAAPLFKSKRVRCTYYNRHRYNDSGRCRCGHYDPAKARFWKEAMKYLKR
jgi:hypothetical protein